MDINEVMKRISNMNNLNPQELQNLQANNQMGSSMAGANMGANAGMQQAAMIQAANEMRELQAKGAAGNGILSQDEINRFVYLRNMLNPNLPQQEHVVMALVLWISSRI
jgi:hypothetical protein